MEIALESGIKRPAALLRALKRGEKVTFAYKDEKVAVFAQADQEEELERMRQHPLGKLLADRTDMDDSAAYVRRLRRARYALDGSGTRDGAREGAP